MLTMSVAAARLRRAFNFLFPGRFRIAGIVLAAFLVVGLITRLGLAAFNADAGVLAPHLLAGWLLLGTLFDLGVGVYAILPFALIAWLAPDTTRSRWVVAPLTLVFACMLCGFMLFVAVSEFVFWNEFGTRFNFIAVDYLIYTNEVIGNIRESYSMPLLFGAIGVATALLFAFAARPL